jgi:hypothetical protein
VPHDAIEAIGWCAAIGPASIDVAFPYPVRHKDGSMRTLVTVPTAHPCHYFARETLHETDEYPKGHAPGSYMLPVDTLFERYWVREYGRKAHTHILKKDAWFQALQDDMAETGLRSPVVVYTDLNIMWGRHRVVAAKRLGWTEIECFITNKTFEQGKEEARIARANWRK